MKKIGAIILLILAITASILIYNYFEKKEVIEKEKINTNFTNEYTLVDKKNVFVEKNIDEIIEILNKKTGIVFMGYPQCPWCQYYAKYLNEVAKENNVKEIYYLNIKKDRETNSNKYRTITTLLKNELLNDDNGNLRVYVPDVTFVRNGKIVLHDNETSVITQNITPKEYWTEEKIIEFKNKMKNYISTFKGVCSSCN